MHRGVFAVLSLALEWLRPQYNALLRFLEFQIQMLRARVDASRIVPTPIEKAELLRLGEGFAHDVKDVMHVVCPATYKRWLRQERQGCPFKRSGRLGTPEPTRNLVLRMARENLTWGYRKIVGELKKLGIRIGATTVRDVLKAAGHFPAPGKGGSRQSIPWNEFVRANAESIVACDFFTKKVFTLRGVMTAYVRVFIHVGSRRVFHSPATYHPNRQWAQQQARNAAMWMGEEGIEYKLVLRDRDAKYSPEFDAFWRDAARGKRCKRIPVRAPKANAYAESFIGTHKKECLNHIRCFSLDQLNYVNRTWMGHYNTRRPHQGKGIENNVLDVSFRPQVRGEVRCKKKLGGLIRDYYRDAA